MPLVDTHAHLVSEKLQGDLPDVLARARAAGLTTMIAVATTAADSHETSALANRESDIYATVGIHPNDTAAAGPGDWDEIVRLASSPRVVALGETGLDRYWDDAPFPLQQDYFDRHIRLSQETELPFIVHSRESGTDVLAMLVEARRRGPLTGVMHSFTADAEQAAQCVELGMYISFAGMVTFKKSGDLRAVAATIPADRILVETDSPYLSPEPLRGKRNEPAHVVHTAACVAAARGQSAEEFCRQTSENAARLFRIK